VTYETIVFLKYSTNINTHTYISTHSYEHTHTIPMSTSERLSWLDIEIHEVGHQERLVVGGDIVSY
jgi:hypothetical protein